MKISIVVPTYNEVENVDALYQQLNVMLSSLDYEYEILFVDDGSSDGTVGKLGELARQYSCLKVVQFRRNYGQTAAMQAGIDLANGDVIVTMDADLQNDPADVPMMLKTLEQGYDLVHGWRKDRQDAWLSRKLPSRIANWLISKSTRFPIRDLGCTLKVMRREIAQELELYGEMHRFIPILAHQRGARCAEVVTRHHPRRAGQTKYGIGRTQRVVLDLLTVKFLCEYRASPMKLFGKLALGCGGMAATCAALTGTMKFFGGSDIAGNPLFAVALLAVIGAVQLLGLGLIAEMNSRTYYGAQNRRHYAIRDLINFEEEAVTLQHPARRAA